MTTEQGAATEHIPRRYLREFLLLGLQQHGTSYGYELCETARSQGLFVDLAGVYRGLRTMDQRGLVTATWAPSENGPDRRVYSLTAEGYAAADAAAAELRALRDALTDAIDGFEAFMPPAGR
jgi:PadR family transcriptional regulator PadR